METADVSVNKWMNKETVKHQSTLNEIFTICFLIKILTL